jgi:hypothetical protein
LNPLSATQEQDLDMLLDLHRRARTAAEGLIEGSQRDISTIPAVAKAHLREMLGPGKKASLIWDAWSRSG